MAFTYKISHWSHFRNFEAVHDSHFPLHKPAGNTAGIYLHIPFCKQACVYCNFHFSTSLRYKDDVLQAILRELEIRKNYLAGAAIETVYFGGGTPSLLTADEINRIFDVIAAHYPLGQIKECTLEANPDDLDKRYLKDLAGTPVTRLSVGVQSFREEDLLYMKRAHNAQQADYAIKAAQDAGFSNLSIDLIYGTPGLTDKDWANNLAKVKELDVAHFSAYALTVEEKTALHSAIARKKAEPVNPEQAARQFEQLMEQSALLGYDHYEISNLAKPGFYAVHNTNYWMGIPYLGIGPSAHSFDGATRRWNVANNVAYIKGVQQGEPYSEEEKLTPLQHLNEYIMTSLRTMWGCDLEKISKDWDAAFAKEVIEGSEVFEEKGWLNRENNKLLLTNAGRLFADRIAGDLFVEDHR